MPQPISATPCSKAMPNATPKLRADWRGISIQQTGSRARSDSP